MTEICPVCVENGKLISCTACDYNACKTCIRRYILEKESDIASCMNCNTVYTRATMVDMHGITFVKDAFTHHQHKVRIAKQTLLLPTLQPIAEKEIKIEKLNQEIKELHDLIILKKQEIFDLETKKVVNEVKYIRPCSIESCNGFLNTKWICGICNIKTCKDCFDSILNSEEEHICKEDLKATATLIKKDTKCCPKCGTGIYKIEGCDQMWCPNCHTAFSWKTGKIEEGRIHNPHYYAHLRAMSKNGEIRREEGDDIPLQRQNCAIQINNLFILFPQNILATCMLSEKLEPISKIGIRLMDGYIDMVRYYYHLDHARLYITDKITVIENHIKDTSVAYIRSKTTKDIYEKVIKNSQKKREIFDEKTMLLTTLIEVIKDILINLFNNAIDPLNNFMNNSKRLIQILRIKPQITEESSTFSVVFKESIANLKETYVKKQDEIREIINYCINEDEKIARVYSVKSYLDIKYKSHYKFLIKPEELI